MSWTPVGFFHLRTPLLPFDEFIGWSAGGGTRQHLRSIFRRPELREAIEVASPSLLERIEGDVDLSLTRYFSRMTSRSTPFGLLAGCSVGTLGEETRIVLAPRATYRRVTDLDTEFATALVSSLAENDLVRPNTSLYSGAGRVRYVARAGEVHRLVTLEHAPHLDAAIDRARGGRSRMEIARSVESIAEVSFEEAVEYVEELIANQVLVSDREPTITGTRPLDGWLAELPDRADLRAVRDALDALDAQPFNGADYTQVRGAVARLPATSAHTLHTDLHKPVTAALLDHAVANEMLRGIEVLRRLFRPQKGAALADFRERFRARYEAREMPLLEVLDEESGIGFPFPADGPRAITKTERFLLEKVFSHADQDEIDIEQGELDAWERAESLGACEPLPDLFCVKGVVSSSESGAFRVAIASETRAGLDLIGRFCHGDPALRVWVERALRQEEALRPDALFAELVHTPQPRVGNVMLRPCLRGWEIPYLARSGAPIERQITVDDLMISIVGQRIVLRSRRLDREVLPRMTAPLNHSFRLNVGVVRFLLALSGQDGAGVRFRWGVLARLPRLPRVVSGRVILSPARWLLDRETVKVLEKARGEARFAAVVALREELHLPRFVGLIDDLDADHVLTIDLDNPLSVETLVDGLKHGRALIESANDGLVVEGPEGSFTHEIVVPFVRRAPATRTVLPARSQVAASDRTFMPGSEWLYAKIYVGAATADAVLRGVIGPFARSALSEGIIDRWFFLRYRDPDPHLRIRFHGDRRQLAAMLPRLHDALGPALADGSVARLQVDTYEREIERYGGLEGTRLSEQIFFADSESVLDHLGAREALRFQLAVAGAHAMLVDLGLDLDQRHRLVSRRAEAFARELGTDVAFQKALGERHRRERSALDAVLRTQPFSGRSEAIQSVAAELRAERLDVEDLAQSHLHMHVNRMLRSEQREQELVICDFLARILQSERARR